MKYLFLAFLVVSTSASFLARVGNHWEEKTKKPECHIEFEDVTEPHCETTTEQVCWEEKTKKPECHIEFEDVTEPHCETITEQVCWEELKNQCETEYSTSCQTEY